MKLRWWLLLLYQHLHSIFYREGIIKMTVMCDNENKVINIDM